MQLDPDAYDSKVKEMVALQHNPGNKDRPTSSSRPNPEKKAVKRKTQKKKPTSSSPKSDNGLQAIAKAVAPIFGLDVAVHGRLNEKFIELLDELAKYMMKKGEPFRARAYQKAQETIMLYPSEITPDNYGALKSLPNIGETIMHKFKEYVTTGKITVLERERADPANILADIYGVGPKKAKELIDKGIRTIDQLRERQDELLNSVQRTGLKYYEDILKRIPRYEIDEYNKIFQREFTATASPLAKYEIVGSYRRGAKTSGDIDVIITSTDKSDFKQFIDRLVETKKIVEILSRGESKCLVIMKLGSGSQVVARRVDFLYCSPDEYPFSVLYFTGSKTFNTVMRGRALSLGYSLNEHGLYRMSNKTKGAKVVHHFADERAIFAFLKMEYKSPENRIDGRSVVAIAGSPKVEMLEPVVPISKIYKKEQPKQNKAAEVVGSDVTVDLAGEHHKASNPALLFMGDTVNPHKNRTQKKTKAEKAAEQLAKAEELAKLEQQKAEQQRLEKEKEQQKIEKQKLDSQLAKANMKEDDKQAKIDEKERLKAEKAAIKKMEQHEKQLAKREEALAKKEAKQKEMAAKKMAKAPAATTRKKTPTKIKDPTKMKAPTKPRVTKKKSPIDASEKKEIKIATPTKVKGTRKKREPKKTMAQEFNVLSPSHEQLDPLVQASAPKSVGPIIQVDPVLTALRHYRENGIKVLTPFPEQTLNKMIIMARNKYYNLTEEDQTLYLTDEEFDILKEYIEEKYPDNEVVQEVGAAITITGKNKVKLPYNMPSMDKFKPDKGDLARKIGGYRDKCVISCKIDGVSGLYSCEGPTPKLYTRGNGIVGQDISHLIPFLDLPNKDLTKDVVVRGEFIMSKATFASKYADKFANARNLVAGAINRTAADEKIRDIHFVTYEVIRPVKMPSEQMHDLAEMGFRVVQNRNVNTDQITNEFLSDILKDWRQSYEYEIDGIIVTEDQIHPRTAGNPEYAFAYKTVIEGNHAEVVVTDVVWTASKDGFLKPVVHFKPVKLSGVSISKATGINGAFIETNKIGLGAVVQIIRSGDVIPKIVQVVKPAEEPLMPTVPYVWNETHIDVLLEDAGSDETVRNKNIAKFFADIKVEGLGPKNVEKIIAAGFDSIPKILKMTEADFKTIDGFQRKMADKLHKGIHQRLNAADLTTIMAASNMMGRGFSSKKVAAILERYPDILISTEPEPDKIRKLAAIEGMSEKTAGPFIQRIPAFLGFLQECGLTGLLGNVMVNNTEGTDAAAADGGGGIAVNPSKLSVDTSHPLYKKNVVFSGVRNKDLEDRLTRIGATISNAVSGNTYALITPDTSGTSTKIQKAKEKGVRIFTPKEFEDFEKTL